MKNFFKKALVHLVLMGVVSTSFAASLPVGNDGVYEGREGGRRIVTRHALEGREGVINLTQAELEELLKKERVAQEAKTRQEALRETMEFHEQRSSEIMAIFLILGVLGLFIHYTTKLP